MGYCILDAAGSIYYEMLEGDAGRPVLVFLHEGLGCCGMWRDFPERLCRNTGCPGLVYDRQGFGRSSPASCARTSRFLHASALEELPALLEHCIPGRPFILIGHSDGGSISLIYGAQRPPLLTGIITEAAHVFVEAVTVQGIRDADRLYRAGGLAGLQRYHGEKTDAVFRAWADIWLSDAFRNWNIEALLPQIACPVLVIQGKDDQYGTERQVQAIAAGLPGRATPVLLDNCRHSPHREAPEAVLALMAAFIGRESASKSSAG